MRLLPPAILVVPGISLLSFAADPPVSTDRPAVTASSIAVPTGSLQFENGFAYTVTQGKATFDGSETLIRLGVVSNTELRLTAPNYFGQPGGTGFGDLLIGMKRQLGPAAGFDASLIVSLSLPTGSRAFSSGGYDPAVQLPWSRSVSQNWTAAGMLSVYWPTQGNRRNVTGEPTFLMDRQLTKLWDAFAEYAGDFPERGGPRHLLHFGSAYKPTLHQQVDIHIGVGLSSASLDHFVAAGYSFRFQLWHR